MFGSSTRFVVLAGLFVTASVSVSFGSSSNPPDFYLNTRGALSCTACHTGGAVNSGPGSIRIEGLPGAYVPGQKYPLRIVISQAGFKKWGFELSATDPAGAQAGKLSCEDLGVDAKISSGITFLKHSFNGTDSIGASRSWSFVWQAPAAGEVSFSFQGVAADGSGTVTGDFCYQGEARVSPAASSASSAD